MYADFDWGSAPLSSPAVPVVAGVAYLTVVALLPRWVPAGGFKGLDGVLVAHNAILSAWSFTMFAGCVWEMLRRMQREGNAEWIFCEEPGDFKGSGPLYFWTYIFYVSKFYEMGDTVLAILRGSSPPHFGLHVYHHALVPLVVRNWLEYRMTLQFPGLMFNTFVHIIMYAYYAMKVLKLPTPWKRWVTRLQIIQFVTSILLLCVTLQSLKGDYFGNTCAGMSSMWVNVAFNVTLLQQFCNVLQTPNRRPTNGKKAE
uniref:Elongation of fatty acids protein n=1 Tax=Zooxanthella nutricula TaxID=1333877 RepID=A0A6U8YR56_9DINO|mmetsp:Transcript_9977/g.29590  ORF Transcript_9977/g.29590 Transcript_9977/m.29590 type:complete len:256 (+) Transcript_9977:51-818(+)